MFAYEKLPGLPRERVLDAIEPVLRAYGLAGVELVWRTDGQGRVLYVTVESADPVAPNTATSEGATSEGATSEGATSEGATSEGATSEGRAEPGQGGVTLEVCSRLSRDLSTAFDVHNLFDGAYRLEVGSPGLERRLYAPADYQRFRGKLAKLKLIKPVAGQFVITGKLAGIDADGNVLLESDDAPRVDAADSKRPPSKSAESKSATAGDATAGDATAGSATAGNATAGSGAPGEAALSSASEALAMRAITFEQIRSGQLVVDWQEMGFSPMPRQRAGRRSAAQGRK